MSNKLVGKVALITGGTAGIGRATARLFAAEGAAVIITGRNTESGAAEVERIQAAGGQALFVACDVRSAEACQQAVEVGLATFGQIDILFNNAGIVPSGTVLETSLEVWREVFATNVDGAFHMSRAVLPSMIERGQGVIVNNGSDWAISGGQAAVAYCATKGAVIQMTRAMALDHARQGIRVNAVCPGDTYVERWDARLQPGESVADHLATLGKGFPMGRVGTVEEIAKAVLFLASDDSSYMTGQLLVVDGGNTAGGTSVKY
ncbi:MAG TPA: SDR family NAD(P)-dependent oxidoreductase [Aggregatilineales bacterium]|nr:SDR family NAD(P)-dependent oxidoreductase [Aggregatilineales bacterium]